MLFFLLFTSTLSHTEDFRSTDGRWSCVISAVGEKTRIVKRSRNSLQVQSALPLDSIFTPCHYVFLVTAVHLILRWWCGADEVNSNAWLRSDECCVGGKLITQNEDGK